MSVNPREAQAFANLLGKLDSTSKPRPAVTEEQRVERMATNDMHSILSAFHNNSGITKSALRLTEDVRVKEQDEEETPDGVSPDTAMDLSGNITPAPQVTSPSGKEDEVPEAKVNNPYAIGMAQAMKSTGDKPPLKKSTITKAHDIAKAIQKDESVDSFAKSLEEELASFKEDKISKDKKKLSDYIGDKMSAEEVIKAIKTVKTDNGKEMKIYGNEDDGFRVKVNNKDSKNVFDSYEEAVMACEMFVARNKNNDYVDEK